MNAPFRLVFPRAFAVELQPQSAPIPRSDEWVLETRYSLISPGTELAFYTGTHIGLPDPHNTWAKYPFAPGYAAVGRVVAHGSNAPAPDTNALYFAPTPHAFHAVSSTEPETQLLRVPDGLKPEHAPFCRLAAIAATALCVTPVQPGQRVAVLGAGLIGNLAAQHFQIAGARVVNVETNPARLEIARKCGLEAVEGGDGARERMESALNGEADVVIEATGVPALVNAALELATRRGRVVLLGSPRGLTEINAYKHIHARGVTMTGAHEGLQGFGDLPTRLELTRHSLDFIARGDIQVAPLLTQILPASQAPRAYKMLLHEQHKSLGVVLDWGAA